MVFIGIAPREFSREIFRPDEIWKNSKNVLNGVWLPPNGRMRSYRPSPNAQPRTYPRMRVLITNFSSASQTVLKAIMIKLGHQMEVAANGREALAILQRPSRPDMAILDSNLPGLDGFEVCRKIKADASLSGICILLMTQENDRSEVLKALDAGADDYLQKPFDLTEVAARLRIAARMAKEREQLLSQIAAMKSVAASGAAIEQEAANGGDAPKKIPPDCLPDDGLSTANGRESRDATIALAMLHALFSEKHAALNALGPFAGLDKLLGKALADMGLENPTYLNGSAAAIQPELSLFSVIVLPQKATWLDMVLEMDYNSAAMVFKAMTGMEEASPEDCADIAGEILNILQGAIKASLQDEFIDVLTPVIPLRIPTKDRNSILVNTLEFGEVGFSLPGAALRVRLFPHPSPVMKKSLYDVKLRDVVAEPVNLPGDSMLTLLNKGIMMNNHHLQKLREMTGYGSIKMKFDMIVPSGISARLVTV